MQDLQVDLQNLQNLSDNEFFIAVDLAKSCALEAISNAQTESELDKIQVMFNGKNGILTILGKEGVRREIETRKATKLK